MKQQKIYMKAWLDAHGRVKAVNTDEWYLISLISYCRWWLNRICINGKQRKVSNKLL